MKVSVKTHVARIFCVVLAIAIFDALPARAIESASAPILGRGRLSAVGSAGSASIDRAYQFAWETALRIGVGAGIEIISPAALSLLLIGNESKGALYFAMGVVDMFVNSSGEILFEPMISLAGSARFGPEASVRAAFDFSGAESGIRRKGHPYWLRGSIALLLDLGSVATLSFGISYQRTIVDGALPYELAHTGWAGNSRISIGSVMSQPAESLPLFSVHLQEGLDFILLTRVDINEDIHTTDVRCLLGFSVLFISDRY